MQTSKQSTPSAEKIVSEVLREWDPEGLIEMGAPEDEYRPEVEPICNRLGEVKSEEDLIGLLQEVFSKMFGRDYTREECAEPGREIFRRLAKE